MVWKKSSVLSILYCTIQTYMGAIYQDLRHPVSYMRKQKVMLSFPVSPLRMSKVICTKKHVQVKLYCQSWSLSKRIDSETTINSGQKRYGSEEFILNLHAFRFQRIHKCDLT